MNAASPGVIAVFQPNQHYETQEAYIEALAEAMRIEYKAIVEAGLLLQIDSPDLAMGRHIKFRDASDEEFLRNANLQVDALNHALQNVPAERVRMHVCWGNYEGPHTHDVALELIMPTVMRAKPQAILFEASNPRHAHEWTVWAEANIPDDKVLIPGVLDTTTNYVEHPQLVAERIRRFTGHRRSRAGAGGDGLWLWHLCRLWRGASEHRVGEITLAGRGGAGGKRAAVGVVSSRLFSCQSILVKVEAEE